LRATRENYETRGAQVERLSREECGPAAESFGETGTNGRTGFSSVSSRLCRFPKLGLEIRVSPHLVPKL
jgi:hypothetical protein